MPTATKNAFLVSAALAIVLACVEFRLEVLLCGFPFEAQAEQVINITRGLPDWQSWQNRLFGPWLFRWSSELLGRDPSALYPYLLLVLRIAKNVLFGLVLLRLKADTALGARYLALFSFLSLATLDVLHLYPWDYLDIMIFSIFLFGVFRGAGVFFFVALFLAAILNRESALFIPLWLVLDSAKFPAGEPVRLVPCRIDSSRLLAGGALLGGGVATVQFFRRALLVRELASPGKPDFAGEGATRFEWNMEFLLSSWHDYSVSMDGLRILFIAAFPLFFILIWRRMDERQLKLAAIVAAMWGSVLLHGIVWETRTYSMLLPFAVLVPFHHLHLRGRAATPAGAGAAGRAGG